MKNTLTAFLLLIFTTITFAQKNSVNKGNAWIPRISFAGQSPGGHLANRFGNSLSFGLGFDYASSTGNWFFGADYNFLFGTEVKEDVVASLRTSEGFIIGNDRTYAEVLLRERGFYAGLSVGKLFVLSKKENRSGIRITLGAGLLQHKVRIQDDATKGVPQLTGDYKKGYDQLSNGLAFNEFIGYQILSNDGRINIMAGFEFTQGLTRNRRSFNFDTQMHDPSERKDYLYSFRITWMVPFYFGKKTEDIYY